MEDDNGEEIADNSDGPLSLCKRKLVHKALKVITKSVAVEETRKTAKHHMDIWLKEVDDVSKKGKEHLNTNYEGVSNTSCVAHVERKEKVVYMRRMQISCCSPGFNLTVCNTQNHIYMY